MNDTRRKKITKAYNELDHALTLINEVLDEEQEALDNLSENAAVSERGEEMQEAVTNLEDAQNNIESAIEVLAGYTIE